jgi:hypothetical protein
MGHCPEVSEGAQTSVQRNPIHQGKCVKMESGTYVLKRHIRNRHNTNSSNPDFDTSETVTSESSITTGEREKKRNRAYGENRKKRGI